jgi:hypothetical protein
MDAQTVLTAHGLTTERRQDKLFVRPADRITDDLRQFIRAHRDELLAAAPSTRWVVVLPDGRRIAMLNPAGLTCAEALRQSVWRWPGCTIVD